MGHPSLILYNCDTLNYWVLGQISLLITDYWLLISSTLASFVLQSYFIRTSFVLHSYILGN